MSAYRSLFRVCVAHDFFSDGRCPGLEFIPTQHTQHIMGNAGLLLRRRGDGIVVSYDEARLASLEMYADDSDDPLCFEFKVYAADPEFRSYSEPFGAGMAEMPYFDNRGPAPGAVVRLHGSDYVSERDLVALDSDRLGSMMGQKDRLLPPVFVLRIYAYDGRQSLLGDWLDGDGVEYRIAFRSRRTYWQYYVLGEMAAQDARVVDADGRLEFEPLGRTALADDREALVFRSTKDIPLHQDYDFRLQLSTKSQQGERVLIKRLPLACISRTGMETIAGHGMVVSEIYVNS